LIYCSKDKNCKSVGTRDPASCNPEGEQASAARKPENRRWSSADQHMKGKDDILVKTKLLLKIVNQPWNNFLSSDS